MTEVVETLAISIVLVILVIFLFFRTGPSPYGHLLIFRFPDSYLFVMWMFGYSINVLTLLAIVLATGLVVDDGIVVTENIYKKVEQE